MSTRACYPKEKVHKLNMGRTLDPGTDEADLIDYAPGNAPAERCETCRGTGSARVMKNGQYLSLSCPACDGLGFTGINPRLPCRSIQGTPFKQAVLTARCRAGMSLWNPLDARGTDD